MSALPYYGTLHAHIVAMRRKERENIGFAHRRERRKSKILEEYAVSDIRDWSGYHTIHIHLAGKNLK